MTASARYPIPAARARVEEVIRRSRFIATADHAPTVEAAQAFVREMRTEFPDASHNCWAYLVGPPGSDARVGMSDDGEPPGTAGRPMLAVLQGSGVGDIVVVVTRYFGGVKLGTGGLVRAYAGSVRAVLAALPLAEKMTWAVVRIRLPYPLLAPLQQLLPEYEAEIAERDFAEEIALAVRLPAERAEPFVARVRAMSRGRAVCALEPTPR